MEHKKDILEGCKLSQAERDMIFKDHNTLYNILYGLDVKLSNLFHGTGNRHDEQITAVREYFMKIMIQFDFVKLVNALKK